MSASQEQAIRAYFPAGILVFGLAAKAAAISLNRILDEGDGVIFRWTQRHGVARLEAVRDLEHGRRPIGWTKELHWSAPPHFSTTVRAISRDRLRVIARHGMRLDETVTVQLGRNNLWRCTP